MEVFSRPYTAPVTLRRQGAMRHSSSSSSLQGALAPLRDRSPVERRGDSDSEDDAFCDGAHLDRVDHAEAEETLPLGSLEGLDDPGATGREALNERRGCEDLLEALCSPAGGIAAALRSVASWNMWSKGEEALSPVPRLLFSSGCGEGDPAEAPVPPPQFAPHEENQAEQRDEDESGESGKEVFEKTESKYIHILPLYQDYWLQCIRTDLCRQKSITSTVTGLSLPGLLSLPLFSPESPPLQPRSLKDRPFSLWQDLPEVQESGVLNTLTPREKRLQEAMFEMIGSEASYLKSLTVAVNHFLGSEELRLTLPPVEHHILFSNLAEVKSISERFLLCMESRLRESVVMTEVGDLVLRHQAALRRAYVPYITNMMYQETLIRRLLQKNREFVNALRKLEGAPVCQRRSLKSFLVLPFQRITQLRIILENILKLTPPDTQPVVSLKEAITAIHQIVTECDNGVQRMKQTEELVHLHKLVDFGSVKSIPLVSSGRYLSREGSLQQVLVEGDPSGGSMVSFRDIYLHLFNDLLLLSLREAGRFSVLDYSVFPGHVQVGRLKTEALGLPPESFLLRLSQNHAGAPTALILTADSSLSREMWVKALSSQTDGTNAQDL